MGALEWTTNAISSFLVLSSVVYILGMGSYIIQYLNSVCIKRCFHFSVIVFSGARVLHDFVAGVGIS